MDYSAPLLFSFSAALFFLLYHAGLVGSAGTRSPGHSTTGGGSARPTSLPSDEPTMNQDPAYPSTTTTCSEPRAYAGASTRRFWPVWTGAMQDLVFVLSGTPLLRASVY
jgi:hypothetical protein